MNSLEFLIYRQPNMLVKADGKAHMDEEAPAFLKHPWLVNPGHINTYSKLKHGHNLFVSARTELDFPDPVPCLFDFENQPMQAMDYQLQGIWSGYRSSIVRGKDGKLYKLKGVAFDPDNMRFMKAGESTYLFGAQKRENAANEIRMMRKFNRVLESEGIEPVIRPLGTWSYPIGTKTKYAASVFEIKGDTRLDEFMFMVDNALKVKHYFEMPEGWRARTGSFTPEGAVFHGMIMRFYYDIGCAVGRLERLLHRSGQSWNSDDTASNVHTGNVVLCRNDSGLDIGLVDFDISCDKRDFPSPRLEQLQIKEHLCLLKTAFATNFLASPRMIGIGRAKDLFRCTRMTFKEFRTSLHKGINDAYHNRKEYLTKINLDSLTDILTLLDSSCQFSVDPKMDHEDFLDLYTDWYTQDRVKGLRKSPHLTSLLVGHVKDQEKAEEQKEATQEQA